MLSANTKRKGWNGWRKSSPARAARLRPEEGLLLPPGYVENWQELRARLEPRRESRRQQRRFRHDPLGYLADLEQRSLQLSLPS